MVREAEVYSRIYDMVADSMKDATGEDMAVSKNVFLHYCNVEPDRTDIGLVSKASEEDLVTMAYCQVLRRLPSSDDIKAWEDQKTRCKSKEEFEEKLMTTVLFSDERKSKNIGVYNNIYCIAGTDASARMASIKKYSKFRGSKAVGAIYKITPGFLRTGVRNLKNFILYRE